jgi:16S rRNA (adenine(1408)-N(1))-methyltransferase
VLFLGIDPVHAALAGASLTATRKRNGASNAVFAVASVESLPAEIAGLASRVTVNLPWGGLLRAVAGPDPALLANVRALCRPDACLDVVYSASPTDVAQFARAGIADPDPCLRRPAIERAYAAAGFGALNIDELPPGAFAALETTWAGRLARDPRRRAWRLSATAHRQG